MTAIQSLTRQAIFSIGRGSCGTLLKEHGFKRQGPHFWRSTGGLFHCVNFQSSQWGTRDEGKFTINLGVTSPSLYSAVTGSAFPKNPGTALWPISLRIGNLRPDHCDYWWQVTPTTNLATLDGEVAVALEEYALPYLSSLHTRKQFEALLLSTSVPGLTRNQMPLVAAAVLLERGDSDLAAITLNAALTYHKGKPFESTIRAKAKELGIKVIGA